MIAPEIEKYIARFDKSAKIVCVNELSTTEKKKLPQVWLTALSKPIKERNIIVVNQWRAYRDVLRNVISILEKNLVSVHLISATGGYSLLYCLKLPNKDRHAIYAGRNPLTASVPKNVAHLWESAPYRLKHFYENCHNGWYFFASQSMGLSPVEDFFLLSDEEWGILEEIDVNLDLNKAMAFYTNGMGSYVCLVNAHGKPTVVLWHKDAAPNENWELWDLVDNWTAIGLEI